MGLQMQTSKAVHIRQISSSKSSDISNSAGNTPRSSPSYTPGYTTEPSPADLKVGIYLYGPANSNVPVVYDKSSGVFGLPHFSISNETFVFGRSSYMSIEDQNNTKNLSIKDYPFSVSYNITRTEDGAKNCR